MFYKAGSVMSQWPTQTSVAKGRLSDVIVISTKLPLKKTRFSGTTMVIINLKMLKAGSVMS